jgi:hypothetical protein
MRLCSTCRMWEHRGRKDCRSDRLPGESSGSYSGAGANRVGDEDGDCVCKQNPVDLLLKFSGRTKLFGRDLQVWVLTSHSDGFNEPGAWCSRQVFHSSRVSKSWFELSIFRDATSRGSARRGSKGSVSSIYGLNCPAQAQVYFKRWELVEVPHPWHCLLLRQPQADNP